MLQDDVRPQPSTEGENPPGNLIDGGDDESMGDDDNAREAKVKTASSRQNEKLYDADGVLNTKLRRAEKKKRKKAGKSFGTEDAMDDDYNFKVDYVRGEAAMDVAEEGDMSDDNTKNRFEVPSGVELDA